MTARVMMTAIEAAAMKKGGIAGSRGCAARR